MFSVVAYLARRRLPELGLRAALGASAADLRGLLLREGVRLALLGVLAGTLAGALSAELLETQLFGVDARDPRALLGSAAMLMSVVVVANLLPARRAAAIPPTEALREE